MKRVCLHEFEHLPVNDRPLRLHQVKYKRWSINAVRVEKADRRIVPIGDDLHADLTFQHRVCVVQNRIDRMRGISVCADLVSPRRARANLMPIIGNWTAPKALPFQRQ